MARCRNPYPGIRERKREREKEREREEREREREREREKRGKIKVTTCVLAVPDNHMIASSDWLHCTYLLCW